MGLVVIQESRGGKKVVRPLASPLQALRELHVPEINRNPVGNKDIGDVSVHGKAIAVVGAKLCLVVGLVLAEALRGQLCVVYHPAGGLAVQATARIVEV